MKRTMTVLIIILLLAGCAPNVTIDIQPNIPDTTQIDNSKAHSNTEETSLEAYGRASPNTTGPSPSIMTSVIPSTPESTLGETVSLPMDTPDSEEIKDYYEIKAEYEDEIERILCRDYYDYAWELLRIFEEMLQFRESLEDINAEIRELQGEQYNFIISIDVKSVFTDGKTNYRVIMFDGGNLPYASLYIQIYDDVFFETRNIGMFAREGGGWDDLLYCDFIQGSEKNYLVIIVKQYVVYAGYIDYRLLSYEIDGSYISNYNALIKEVSHDLWIVKGMNYEFYGGIYIEISYSDTTFWLKDWLNLEYIIKESFEDNIFTVALDMDLKAEISLLFNDGYWEVVAAK